MARLMAFGRGVVSRRTRVLVVGLAVLAVVLAPVPFTAQPAEAAAVTIPADLGPGDTYRIMFVTTGTFAATSTDVADYNNFAAAEAASVPALASLGTTWSAVVSVAEPGGRVDARDNTNTNPLVETGVPIYALSGLRIADDNADLWDGVGIQNQITDSSGTVVAQTVNTGTFTDGTGPFGPLGAPGIDWGRSQVTTSGWIGDNGAGISQAARPIYVMSGPLKAATTPTVDAASPFVGGSVLRCATTPNCLAQFYDTSDNLAHPDNGALPAVAKDVIAGFPDIHDPTYVNDGYYGNGASWIGTTSNSWVKVDLGTERCVESVRFGRDRLGNFNDRDPGQIRIFGATTENAYVSGDATNDAAEYTLIFETDATYPGTINGAETLKASFSPTAVRYLKFEVTAAGAAIDELEVAEGPLGSCSSELPLVHFDATDLGGVDNASGDVELESATAESGRFVEFDAEAGTLHWLRASDGSEFDADITSYLVDGPYAEMLGTVTSSTFSNIFPGFTFRFEVWDGTPDTAAWEWLTGLTASQTYDVIAGDLAVRDFSADGEVVSSWAGQTAVGTPTYLTEQTPNGSPAVEFNGSDRFADNLLLPASSTGDWIVAAVIKAQNIGAYHNLVDDNASNRPMLWIDPSFNYELNFTGGTGAKAVGTGVGGWDVVIADSRLNQLYVNSPVPNATGRDPIPFTVDETFDFFHRDGGQTFKGQVAELRLYSDAAAFGGDFAALYSELAAKHLGVAPVEYSMAGGNGLIDGGVYDYFDDLYGQTASGEALSGGLGDLTDGVVATLSWNGALPGSKDPYVGWVDFTAPAEFPPIAFSFGEIVDLDRIRVWVSDASGGDVYPPTGIDVTMGGVTQSYPVTPPAGTGPFAIDLNMAIPPTELPPDSTVVIAPQGDVGWIFISEVEFFGAGGYTIQGAIDAASPGDIVVVPAGTYNEMLYIAKDLTLQGPDPGTGDPVVTVHGTGFGESVVYVEAETTVTLRDLTITGGSGSDGGGIYTLGDLSLDGVAITGNTAAGDGGGILNDGGHLELLDSKVLDNGASGNGGGIATIGSFGGCEICTLVLTDTVVSGNTAGGSGGGIYGSQDSIAISGSHIFDNAAVGQGGGIASSYEDMTITNSTVGPENTAQSGGGISNGEGTATLVNVTISGNEADYGGGIYEWSGVTTVLDHVTITENVAHTSGPGTYQDYGNIEATNSIIAGNTLNVIQDGSFEYGLAPPGGNYLIDPPTDGSITLGAWTYHYVYCSLGCGAPQSYPLLGAPWGPEPFPDGDEVLNLGRSFDPGRIEQTFSTEVGQQYDVSLWAINAAGFADGQGRVTVSSTSGTHLNSVFTVGNTNWQQFTYSFTAADTSTTIQLENLGTGGASSHDALVIDDVRVEAAQECGGTDMDGLGATLEGTSAHNVIGVGDGCSLTDGVTGNIVSVDPLLGPLADNGGATPTHALDAGSPAVDAGAFIPRLEVGALQRNSSAVSGTAGLDLITANGQVGSAFEPTGVPLDGTSFETTFDFRITDLVPWSGYPSADGLTFIVADSPFALGVGGGSLGVGGLTNSVSVEFDTFMNSIAGVDCPCDDPNGNHLGINIGGNPITSTIHTPVGVTNETTTTNAFDNGEVWTATVTYDADTDQLSATVSSPTVASVNLSATVDLASVVGATGYFGFTSSAGAAGARHTVTNWSLATDAACAVATDQRGEARPENFGCDIGAFEAPQPADPTADIVVRVADPLAAGGGLPEVGAGASEVALDGLFQFLTDPVSSPISSVPISSVPISSVPISSVPISSVPISSVPISSVPISSVPISSVPISSVNAPQPASTGACGTSWQALLEGTPFADLPLQTVILQDVLDPASYPGGALPECISLLVLGNVDLSSNEVGSLSLASISLGATGIGALPIGTGDPFADWCAALGTLGYSCLADGWTPSKPVAALHIAGVRLSSMPMSSVPISSVYVSTPISSVPISSVPISSVPISSVQTMFDCVPADCSSIAPDATFGDLVALGWLKATATFADFFATQLPPEYFPWEDLPLDQIPLQLFQNPATASLVTYEVGFTLEDVPGAQPAAVAVTLPDGFVYAPGTTTFDGLPLADTALTVDLTNLQWDVGPLGSGTYLFSFQAHASLDLGVKRISASVEVPSLSLTAALVDRAPVRVVENFEGEVVPLVDDNTLYLAHIASDGDIDRFDIPVPATEGTLLRVSLSNLTQDNDMVLYRPTSDALSAFPTGDTAQAAQPIEDDGINGINGKDSLAPETLQDIPISSVPISSVSATRGTASEEAQATVAAADIASGGTYQIQVSGYNGLTSRDPYVLIVEQVTQTIGSCPPKTWPYSDPGATAQTISLAALAGVDTVILVDQRRLARQYGATAAADVVADLTAIVAALNGGALSGHGLTATLIDVEAVIGHDVAGPMATWDDDPCNVDRANNVVSAITAILADLDAATPLRFVTVVGSDELIPMARVPDLTKLSNEKDYAGYFDLNTTLNGTFGAGYVLTDDAYGDRNPIAYLDRQLFVPDFAVGRLIETPTEIRGAVALFLNSGGALDPQTSLVTGYDFLNDGATTVANVLDDVIGTPADRTLINDRWTAAGLRSGLLPPDGTGTDASADVIAVNAHFDHYRSQPARTTSPFQIVAYASNSEVQPSATTTINVAVKNLSTGPITLTSLVVTDPDAAICPALVGVEIAAGAELTCTFDVTVGATVGSYSRTVLAEALGATDESGSLAAGTVAVYDEAIIDLVATNSPAALQMRATPVSDQPSAPSAGVNYAIAVTNTTASEMFVSGITDPTGTSIPACDSAAPLAAGATLECSFTETLTGTPGDRLARTFTASATDGSGAAVGASAVAVVEFLGLVDTGHLVADKLAGSIIFSMGCHAGLNVPDSIYSIAGDPRAADWAQKFAAQGAIYFANTGFGYGDTASVALSERLMALFAQRLDGSVFAGEAGMYAKQAYVGSLGLYGVYDEKVLAEAVFYGLPFYFVGGPPTGAVAPPPLPISEDAGTGLPSASLSLTSIALGSETDPATGGSIPSVDSYDLDLGAGPTNVVPDGNSLLTVHYRPLQPLISIDVTPDDPTVVPHGAMITHLVSAPDQVGLRAKFMRPIIDNGQDEKELVFGDTIFPSVLQSITSFETETGTRHNLNLAPGQFFMTDAGAGTGIQRSYVAMDAVVRYSDIPEFDPPTIRRTQAVVDGGSVIFRIEVEPADGRTVVEANVLFKDESGDWEFAPLALISGDVWGTQVSGIIGERVEFFTQAADDAGNVAVSTNKAEFYVARLLTGSLESGVAVEGDTVTLQAFFADPAIGTTHVATIDWGDGKTSTLIDVDSPFSETHTYANEGEYTILIRVVSNGTGADAYDESAVTSATIENAVPVVNAGPPQNATIPGTVQFVATFSDAGTDDVHTATIDWGDGTTSPGTVKQSQGRIVASHDYTGAASQTYVITVTVSDGTDSASASKVLNATGTPPPVTTDAQDFSVAEGSVASVSGAFGGPGPITVTGPPGLVDNGGGSWTWTRTPPDGPATIPVTITATGPGGTSSDSFTVSVTNVAPTVSVGGAPATSVPAGTVVNLLATATDPAGTSDPLTYQWSITGPGGAITRTTAQAAITTRPGSYSATVTVSDGDGGSITSSAITWNAYAPVAVTVSGLPNGPVAAGAAVQLRATPTGGLTPLTTGWKVNGNPAPAATCVPASASDVCVDIPTATPGQVSATVTVTDSAGAKATASGVITVYEPLAVVSAAPDDPVGVNEGETAIVSGAFSGSGDIDITADTPGLTDDGGGFWTWSAYQPDGPASFAVTVTATGPFNQVITDTFDVAVANLDPTVSIDGEPGLPVAVGTSIDLEALASDVIDDPLTYTWEVTSSTGTTTTNSPPELTVGPLDLGEYTVTVTANDGDGGSASDTVTLIAGPPQITSITVDPVDPAPFGTAVTLTVDYDLYADSATVVWGDGTPPESLTPSGGTFSLTHTYVATGVFQAQVSVSAQTVGVDQGESDFIVVFGTTGTSVRGNKEYAYEAGDLVPDPTAAGTAKFGFNVKPKNDGSLKGSVKLDLKDLTGVSGDDDDDDDGPRVKLRSTTLEWLATSNDWAQVFGQGTVKCLPDPNAPPPPPGDDDDDDNCTLTPVEFKLTVIDGDVAGGDGNDRIRIVVHAPGDATAVIYDNEFGAPAAARPETIITKGKIKIKNPNIV